jgi:hypothetical protein
MWATGNILVLSHSGVGEIRTHGTVSRSAVFKTELADYA